MTSFYPATSSSAAHHASPSSSTGAVSMENNARFEDELYVFYLQARSRGLSVSSAGLLEWAQEIASDNGYYDRDDARSVLTSEWLSGWYNRYNVDDADADDGDGGFDQDQDQDADQEHDNNDVEGDAEADVDAEEGEHEEGAIGSASLVLYPPPIGNPLTPSPPPAAANKAALRHTIQKNLMSKAAGDHLSSAILASNGGATDIESVVNNYMSTPAPRSRLFEHMLAESAVNLLMAYMNDTLHMGEAVRPETLPPEELNRILIQFFRQLRRPGSGNDPYPVKVLHGVLEGLSRYLRGCGYSCDLAYESNFSEARTAFGEQLMKSFEYESKQRHMANKANNGDSQNGGNKLNNANSSNQQNNSSSNDDDDDYEEVTKKMQQDHRLRPLGTDECPPDEAMASFNKNTQKVMTWAAKNVVAFGRERLGLSQFTRVEEMPPELLNIVLTRFFCESRKADGTEFGWNSYKSVFSNLEAYLRVHRYPLGLHDPIFRLAKQTLFNVLRPTGGSGGGGGNSNSAASAGGNTAGAGSQSANSAAGGRSTGSTNANNGAVENSAARPLYHRPIEINSAEENILWSQGAFGWHSPQAINTTLYYYMRHIYGVRSGESHRRINFGDLRTMRTDDGREEFLVYTKAAAGVDMSRLRRMWATRDDRCIVRVFKVMVAKRPPETRKPDAPLYLQPKRQRQYILESNQAIDNAALPTADEVTTDCWFTTAPLGKNALATLMREAYQSCGLDTNRFPPNSSSHHSSFKSSNGPSMVGNSSSNGNANTNRRFSNGASRVFASSDGMDDDDNLAESSNDDAASSSSSRPGSSSSFSHPPSAPSHNYHASSAPSRQPTAKQSSCSPTNMSSNMRNSNGRSTLLPPPNNSSSASSFAQQSQAIDLASNSNRKRDNLGRFTGGVGSSTFGSSSLNSNNNQEALSLCTGKNEFNRSRVPNVNGGASDLVIRPKTAKLSPALSESQVKAEPASKVRSSLNQRANSPSDQTETSPSSTMPTPGALSASAFGNGVGNMSISMQPQTAADMADVVGFLNQFLTSLNSNSSSSASNGSSSPVFKCNINVTVNISK